jgi:hypothetical protein
MFNVDEKVFLFGGRHMNKPKSPLLFFSVTFKTTAKLTIVCDIYRTLEID